jgi:hypothetical protein
MIDYILEINNTVYKAEIDEHVWDGYFRDTNGSGVPIELANIQNCFCTYDITSYSDMPALLINPDTLDALRKKYSLSW